MTSNAPVVLIIEDDPPIRRFLRATLGAEGYSLREAATGEAGVIEAASHPPDIVLLDLGLPDVDGLNVIQRLRSWSTVPIIIISARRKEGDMVAALDTGANDYVTKPFSVLELKSRIRVALRYSQQSPGEGNGVFTAGDLTVDLAHRHVTIGQREVLLTRLEFKLLAIFVKYAGNVITHRQLLEEVWGPKNTDAANYLRVYIHQLRRKVEEDPARPKYLLTESGIGYRLQTDPK